MVKKAAEYAKTLHELHIHQDVLMQAKDIMEVVPQIHDSLQDPTLSLEKKHDIIVKIFPSEIRDFFKLLIDNHDVSLFSDILDAFHSEEPVVSGEAEVVLRYVTPPTDEQLESIRDFMQKECKSEKVNLILKKDESLGGGFILRSGNKEYDWSTKGRLKQLEEQLKNLNSRKNHSVDDGIISILRSEIEEFEVQATENEIGTVTWVGDGIANIDGIDHAVYGEIVIFDCGIKGMVQDIRRDEIGVILFGKDREVREGSRVVRTGRKAGMPVGDAFLGRIIDALGAPIDGQGTIKEDDFRPVENDAPGITERKSVTVPLQTGILSIDSMFPIGRGQRELIIGDRQTGKTSIATDTIINQKGKDVICIYVAIGQKASTVAKIVSTLKKNDAMDYTIIVSSTASDPAPLQYIAPYSATSLAEYFMYKGKDVLVIYDDLSKHAVAYRAISLLLERPPGREAYPGDVFYLHSRLLERSARISDEIGGGSITSLPIIETQAGDVSAYIPTNVISITDGQIFLESDLFNAGMRPAVNVGLSVSRVGGAAQTKAMKKAAGSIRIDLAQYREMEVFTQFSSDLDAGTKAQLAYGKSLMELLKQPLCKPLSMAEQVITLVCATDRLFVDLPIMKIKEFQSELLVYFAREHQEIIMQLENEKSLPDELAESIRTFGKEFKAEYFAE